MFRAVVPRVFRQAARLRPSQVVRGYCDRRSRWVPANRSFFDGFFPSSMSRMMDRQFRQMDKMMDDLWNMRFPERDYFLWPRPGAKDVEVIHNSAKFEVRLDVSQFAPEEVNVKVAGSRLTVSAKHQEKPDQHGFISREFTRQFEIPEDVESESIESLLTSEGHLVVRGKVKGAEDSPERVINIVREEPKTDTKQETENK